MGSRIPDSAHQKAVEPYGRSFVSRCIIFLVGMSCIDVKLIKDGFLECLAALLKVCRIDNQNGCDVPFACQEFYIVIHHGLLISILET